MEMETAKSAIEMFLVNVEDKKLRMVLQSFVDKCQMCIDMKLSLRLTEAKKAKYRRLVAQGSELASKYSRYAGDMGMINEFDLMKKEATNVADSLGDAEGALRADSEAAKREMEVILDRIKEELINEESVKSNAEAERRAKMDMRYTTALEDYRELLTCTYVIRNKFKNVTDTRDDIRQSVSTARNSIISEGYNK